MNPFFLRSSMKVRVLSTSATNMCLFYTFHLKVFISTYVVVVLWTQSPCSSRYTHQPSLRTSKPSWMILLWSFLLSILLHIWHFIDVNIWILMMMVLIFCWLKAEAMPNFPWIQVISKRRRGGGRRRREKKRETNHLVLCFLSSFTDRSCCK